MRRLIPPFRGRRTTRIAKDISLSALGLAEGVLDGVPVPGAKVGISLVLEVIRGIDTSAKNEKILGELQNHLQFLSELLQPFMTIDRLNLSSSFFDDVQRLNKDLEIISRGMKSKGSRGLIRLFLDRHTDESELQSFSQNLKSALDRFHLSQTLRQEKESLLRERSTFILTLPLAHDAGYDSGRNNPPLSCLTGTRVSILAQIIAWLEDTSYDTPPVYWLDGLAGIGKSTIAKTIAEQSSEKGVLGGSFFFSANDDSLCDPQLMIPTLAFQLAQSDKVFMKYIVEALKGDPIAGHRKLLPQFESLILTPLLKVHEVDPGRRTTLIVIDVIDECKGTGATDILRLVFSHATRIPFLRILITSRPEPRVTAVFDEARNYTKMVLHDIQASVIQHDIRLYIHAELAKIPRMLGLTMPAEWTTEDERNALVERSGKLFVYAATSIRFIGDDRVRDPRRHLHLILSTRATYSEELEEARPYAQLDILYMGVLRNYYSELNPRVVLDRFQVVVGSIVLLRQALPLHSLARFVEYSVSDVQNALHHLRSVIIPASNIDEAPRIYHPSFLDFITSTSRCTLTHFTIVAVPNQERRHALRCFDLMAKFLKRDVARIRDPSLLNSEVYDLKQKVNNSLPLEVQYACRYWATHLSHVQSGDHFVIRALEEFSMRSILWWFEAMCLIGGISAAAGYIREAHRWATVSECKTTIATILSDAHSFILSHSEAIRASVLHVYHSALLFTPRNTMLYKAYCQEGDVSVGVLQGVDDQWLCLRMLRGHSEGVRSVAYSRDGLRLASCSYDHTVWLWDAVSGAHTATLEGHLDKVNCVSFSPDGLRLASCSHDCTIRIWNTVSGACLATLTGHLSEVYSVAFSPDGSPLASSSGDRTVAIWDAVSGTQTVTFAEQPGKVYSVAFSPDGVRLASCSGDGVVRLWDVVSGARTATLEGHSGEVYSVAFSPDGLRLASSWALTKVKVSSY